MRHAVDLPPQRLSVLLRRIAEELHALQVEGRSLEDAIGRAILGEEPSTRETLAHLQGVDTIVQTLGELAVFVNSVTRLIPHDPDIDASVPLAQVSLRDLASKLSGSMRQPVVDGTGAISGEVDLF